MLIDFKAYRDAIGKKPLLYGKTTGENIFPPVSFPPSFVFLAVVVIVGGRTRDLIQPEYFHHLGKEAVYT
mgnify:CR=1 FL=1